MNIANGWSTGGSATVDRVDPTARTAGGVGACAEVGPGPIPSMGEVWAVATPVRGLWQPLSERLAIVQAHPGRAVPGVWTLHL